MEISQGDKAIKIDRIVTDITQFKVEKSQVILRNH